MNQLSRKYNKRVEIWRPTLVPDGFGGHVPGAPALDKTVWMAVLTNVGKRATDAGITEPLDTVRFELRYREGIDIEDTFFVYKGVKYVLQSVNNLNEMNEELICYGTK